LPAGLLQLLQQQGLQVHLSVQRLRLLLVRLSLLLWKHLLHPLPQQQHQQQKASMPVANTLHPLL
jgi:hypothetical protein